MTNNPPSRATKKAALRDLIREAVHEQQNPSRDSSPFQDEPFESRINQTFWRARLAEVLKTTDALDILGELVDDSTAGA